MLGGKLLILLKLLLKLLLLLLVLLLLLKLLVLRLQTARLVEVQRRQRV